MIKLFGNKKLFFVLNYFLENPSLEIKQVELLKKLKIAKATAVYVLKILEKEKLINCKKISNTKLYRLNKENLIVKHLKIILNLKKLEDINELFNTFHKNIEIYLFGSFARGEDNENSDIDLLILGKLKKEDIFNKFEKLEKRVKKKINFLVFEYHDWIKMKEKDNAFYERVEKDKIRIF